MNIAFLVEGKTELRLYPKWINHFSNTSLTECVTMLKGANRTWHYGKSTAHNLIDIPYLKRIEQRLTETPTHLQTFSDMVSFLKSL
jgi:hypothetical protein